MKLGEVASVDLPSRTAVTADSEGYQGDFLVLAEATPDSRHYPRIHYNPISLLEGIQSVTPDSCMFGRINAVVRVKEAL